MCFVPRASILDPASPKHSPEQELPVVHVPRLTMIALFVLAACERERPHVFQQPPPRAAAQPVPSPTAALADVPLGSLGADARITSVSATATGTPLPLSGVAEPFDVMIVVARGPGDWTPGADARIELLFTGTHRASFVRPLERPTPTIIAHVFKVPTVRESAEGLRPGNYRMQVRLIMRDSIVWAESAPLLVTIR